MRGPENLTKPPNLKQVLNIIQPEDDMIKNDQGEGQRRQNDERFIKISFTALQKMERKNDLKLI